MKSSFLLAVGLILFFAISDAIAQPIWLEDPPEEITIVENDTCVIELEVLDDGEIEEWRFTINCSARLRAIVEQINDHRCRISLRPWEDSAGEYLLRIFAHDPFGNILGADINIIVLNLNRPPEFVQAIPDIARNEDFSHNRFLIIMLSSVFNDPDGDTIEYRLNDLPPELGLLINHGSSGLSMQLEPNYFTPEPVTVIVTASDGEFAISDTFLVTISPVDDPPGRVLLISPADNSVAPDSDSVDFVWSQAEEVDGDTINYTLIIYQDVIDTLFIDAGLDTLATVASDLLWMNSRLITWQVVSSDGHSNLPNIGRYRLSAPLSVASDEAISPDAFSLLNVYPNPFNSSAIITYTITKPGRYEIGVVDLHGRFIENISKGWMEAGNYRQVWNADGLGTGAYIVRYQSNNQSQQQLIIFQK